MDIFNAFPSGKDRKAEAKISKDKIDALKRGGKKSIYKHYKWIDSPMDPNSNSLFELEFSSFATSFEGTFPLTEKSLKAYIEQTLEKRKGEAVGIEFGGIGSHFFSGFSNGFFKQSVGVTLIDHRNEMKQYLHSISNPTHRVLEGDIFSADTYMKLESMLAEEKVDLIVERLQKGLDVIPIEPYSLSRTLEIWYHLLNEGGLMFVQTPIEVNNLLKKWADMIREEFKGVLEIEYKEGKRESVRESRGAFCLRKLPGAPVDLPLLDPRTLKGISREKPVGRYIK